MKIPPEKRVGYRGKRRREKTMAPYAVDIFTLTCSRQFRITEQSTGESLKNFTFAKGYLVIADRAYGTIKSIEHCFAAGGDFLIRIKNKPFHINDGCGRKLDLADWLHTVGESAAELSVSIRNREKNESR